MSFAFNSVEVHKNKIPLALYAMEGLRNEA